MIPDEEKLTRALIYSEPGPLIADLSVLRSGARFWRSKHVKREVWQLEGILES